MIECSDTYTAGWDLHGSGEALLWLGFALGNSWIGSCQCLDGSSYYGSLTGRDGQGEANGDGNSGEIHFELYNDGNVRLVCKPRFKWSIEKDCGT